jgi:hypothetical protein
MAQIRALLAAEDAMTLMTTLDAMADRPRHPDDLRPIHARRADALVELAATRLSGHPTPALPMPRGSGGLEGDTRQGSGTASGTPARHREGTGAYGTSHRPPGLNGGGSSDAQAGVGIRTGSACNGSACPGTGLPTWHGRRPHIEVTVALTTLLGLDENPAELAGYGPINAQTARRIAADGTWRRLLTDPTTGHLLDYGRTTYRPPADLRDFIIARDRTCTFPGCARQARRCDLDHIQPYSNGGTTDDTNLHALCRRHHRARHEAGWTVTRNTDDTTTWTSPAGKTLRTQPPSLAPP